MFLSVVVKDHYVEHDDDDVVCNVIIIRHFRDHTIHPHSLLVSIVIEEMDELCN